MFCGEDGTRTHDLLNANQTLSPNWATTPKIDSNCLSILSLSPPRYKSRPGEVQRLHHGYTHRVWTLATSIQVPDLTTDWFVIPPRRERVIRFELTSRDWKSHTLTAVLYPHIYTSCCPGQARTGDPLISTYKEIRTLNWHRLTNKFATNRLHRFGYISGFLCNSVFSLLYSQML